MKPQTFIFIGRSGCGKGTQAKFLQEYLCKGSTADCVFYAQTGAEFRSFIKGNSITQKLSKEIYDKGGFQPEFLAIFMWANLLVKEYKSGQHIIFDGLPRKYHEAGVLDSIISFYGLDKPNVIYVDIPKEEAVKRLLSRKRSDDMRDKIEERLGWYETEVIPTIEYFKKNSNYKYHRIDGMGSPEKIHADILKAINI